MRPQRGSLTSRSQGSQSLKQLTARLGLDTVEKEPTPFPPLCWSSLIVGCGSNTFGQVSGSTQENIVTSLKATVLPIAGDNGIHVVALSAGPQLSAAILQTEEATTLPIAAGSDQTYIHMNATNVLYLWGTGLAGVNYRQPTPIQLPSPVPSSSSSSSSSSHVAKGGEEGKERIKERSEMPLHPLSGSLHRSIHGVTHVSCGHAHIGVITTEGHVFSWGEGSDGRLGHGTRTSISVPKLISSMSKLRALSISCGAFHTAIVACDRGLFAEGNHRLLVPITATRSSSSRTSSKTSSRPSSIHRPRLDDLIEEEGEDDDEEEELQQEEEEDGNGNKRDVTQLDRRHSNPPMTSNSAHSSSQATDEIELHCGDLYVCGLSKAGQLGLGSQGSRDGGHNRSNTATSNMVAVPTRVTHFDREEDVQGGIGYKVAKVSCGMHHTLMLCVPASSWQTGREVSREGSPRPSTSGTAPESNFLETVVFSCGYNEHGRLGVGDEEKREIPTRIVFPAIDGGASSTGVSRSFYSSFNTCNGAKDFFRSGTGPPTFTATDISAGEQHSLVSGNGACFAFGSNEYGQCGIGAPSTTEMAMTPVLIPIPEGVTVKAIAAGGRHSAAITTCGKFLLFGWGEDAQCTQNEKNVYWPRPARIPRFEKMTRPVEEEHGRRDRREEMDEEEGAKVARYFTTTPVAMALGMSHTLLVLKNVDFFPPPPKPLAAQPAAVVESSVLGLTLVDPVVSLTVFEEPHSPSVEKKQDMVLQEMNDGLRKSAMLADEDDEGGAVRAVRGIRELLAHQRKDEEKGIETNQSSTENEDREEQEIPKEETSFAFFMTEEDDDS